MAVFIVISYHNESKFKDSTKRLQHIEYNTTINYYVQIARHYNISTAQCQLLMGFANELTHLFN